MPRRSHNEYKATSAVLGWRRCVVCAVEPGSPICDGCAADFFPADAFRCSVCAERIISDAPVCGACLAHPPHFDGTTALADYRAPVDGMIAALKFGGRIDLAGCFARLLAARDAGSGVDDLVIAVPLSFERESERGFNQSREIARSYAHLAGLPLGEDVLWRVRHTPPQQSLARDARQRNMRGAFGVKADLGGRRVVVVDDVMTTGSTLDEIARVLKAAGAVRVKNLVVARTP